MAPSQLDVVARSSLARPDAEAYLALAAQVFQWLDVEPSHVSRRRRRVRVRVWRALLPFLTLVTLLVALRGAWLATAGTFLIGMALAVLGWLGWLALSARRARSIRATALPSLSLTKLPQHTSQWLEQERIKLPLAAQAPLDAITRRLAALTPQVQTVDPEADGLPELRRLLAEELPELLTSYGRLPRTLTQQRNHAGTIPERQLAAGLTTIDAQLQRLHERLAERDLQAFATQLRYLDLKYGNEGDV